MANIATVTGVRTVLKNLKAKNDKLGRGIERGLKIAGLRLQRASQKMVPVEFGVLKASAFTRATGSGLRTVVNVGYTAEYAIYVHENVEMKGKGFPRPSGLGNYWDPQPQAGAKFLERPARSMRKQLRRDILAAGGIY